jgi:hypothetical protein
MQIFKHKIAGVYLGLKRFGIITNKKYLTYYKLLVI